ncbi:MAG: hypothetical protein ACP5RN_04125 [Armatimonadota bacterium]
MKVRLLMLGLLLALLVTAGNAQDNLDSPWGVKNADIYATNAFPVWQLPTASGWVDTPVNLAGYAIRSGGHYEVQTVFDSEGNIYFRGSIGQDDGKAEPVVTCGDSPCVDGRASWIDILQGQS